MTRGERSPERADPHEPYNVSTFDWAGRPQRVCGCGFNVGNTAVHPCPPAPPVVAADARLVEVGGLAELPPTWDVEPTAAVPDEPADAERVLYDSLVAMWLSAMQRPSAGDHVRVQRRAQAVVDRIAALGLSVVPAGYQRVPEGSVVVERGVVELEGDPFAAAVAWIEERWPGQSIESRGLALAEEAGEVCRAILKRVDHSRGDPEHWTEQIRKETADVLAVLAHLGFQEGWTLHEAMAEWVADRPDHHTVRPLSAGDGDRSET